MNHNLRNFLLLLLALCGGLLGAFQAPDARGQTIPARYDFPIYRGNIGLSDSIKVRPIDTTQALTVQARYTNVGPVLPGNLQPTLSRSKLRVYVQWLTGTVNLPQTLWYELKSGTQTIVSGTVSVNYNGVSIPGIPGVALTGINSQLGSLADSYTLLSSTKLSTSAFTSYSAANATALATITSQLASSTTSLGAIAASVASFSATYLANRTADLAATATAQATANTALSVANSATATGASNATAIAANTAALDGKAPTVHTHTSSSITDFVVTARTAINTAGVLSYNNTTGVLSIPQASSGVSGYLGSGDYGTVFGHIVNVDNPHNVTKAQLGLGSVPNIDPTSQGYQTASQVQTASDLRYRRVGIGLDYNTDITSGKPTIPTSASDIGAVSLSSYNTYTGTNDATNATQSGNIATNTTAINQLKSTIATGQYTIIGTWNPSTNTPTLSSSTTLTAGSAYAVSTTIAAGVSSTVISGSAVTYFNADLLVAVSNGTWIRLSQALPIADNTVTTAKLGPDVLHKNFPFQPSASPSTILKAAIKDIQIVGPALNPNTLLTLGVFRKNVSGTGQYTIQTYDYTQGNFSTQAYNFSQTSYTPSATLERLTLTGIGSFSATTMYVTVDWSQAPDNTVLNSMSYGTAGLSNLVFQVIPTVVPTLADGSVPTNKLSTSLQTTLTRRLPGKNLLKNYRLEGTGTYPDNFTFDKTTGSSYVGLVASTSPVSFSSAKFTVAATSGVAGYVIWYHQGVNVDAFGLTGKNARLYFYIKTDQALSSLYIRPKNGASASAPIYTDLKSQVTTGAWSWVKSDVFALISGTDVGYGVYPNMAAGTVGTTANVEIAGVMLRLEDDGEVYSFEPNGDFEITRQVAGLTDASGNKLIYGDATGKVAITNLTPSFQTTIKNRLTGKNLLKNYRLEGTGTYPDNFTLEKTTSTTYVGQVTGTSSTSLPSAKFSIAATSGAAGYVVWYQQGVNVDALGIAGKNARLYFYIKSDIALSSLYIRPRNGTSAGGPIYTDLKTQMTVGQWSLVKSDLLALPSGTDVGYGVYPNMASTTFGTTANVEISSLMLRLEDDGDVYGFEYNSNYEATRSAGAVTSDQLAAALINPSSVTLSLPSVIYAVKGDQLEIFKRSLIKVANPDNVGLGVANASYPAAKGNFYERVYRYTPGASDVSFPLTFEVRDVNTALLASATTQITVVSKKSSPSTNKNILLLGDSFIAQQTYVDELVRRLKGTGGTPAGDGLTNLTFIGTKGTTNKHEGVGGKTYTWFQSNESPFWNPNTSQIDFAYYCSQNGFSGIDAVLIQLGTNDKGEPDAAITGLWDKLKAYNSNIKVLVGATIFANPKGGWGTQALDAVQYPSLRNYLGGVKATFDYNRRVEALSKLSAYNSNFFFVDILPGFDVDNNMQFSTVPANARNSTAIVSQGADNVHPASSGYYQIADAIWRGFHAVILP